MSKELAMLLQYIDKRIGMLQASERCWQRKVLPNKAAEKRAAILELEEIKNQLEDGAIK